MTQHLQPGALLSPGLLPLPPLGTDRAAETWVALGWPGLDPAEPCLDIVAFDRSGSVSAAGGNDPIGNRFSEAARALKVVAAWCGTKRSKAIVIHFDQPSHGDTPVVSLNADNALRTLAGGLRIPRDAAGTSELAPSLSKAETLAARYPDHTVRLTILSDFELTDADPSDVFARLAAFSGEVHAVVLNAEPPADLRGENIAITRLHHTDPPGALAAAIHRSLTATRRGRRVSPVHVDRTQPSIPPLSPDKASGASPTAGAVD